MKIAAYILFVLQAVSIFGTISGEGLGSLFAITNMYDIGRLAGFFLPTIIGIILLNKAKKKEDAKKYTSSEELAQKTGAEVWTCSKCKTANLSTVNTCQKCGVTKQWSDQNKKN